MKNSISISYLIAFCLSALTTFSSPARADAILAKINDRIVTLEEFNQVFKENVPFFQEKTPTKAEMLDELVKKELAVQEARKLGLEKDPETARQIDTLLYHALINQKVSKELEKITLSDDDLKSYYDKNPQIRTSHVFVPVAPNASEGDKKASLAKITKIQDTYLIKQKMSFADVARKYSEGPNAPIGGDLDYRFRYQLDPDFYQTALQLKTPGKTSEIIQLPSGYHIIKLTGIRPWKEVNQTAVKRFALQERKKAIFDQYMSDLRSKAKVETHNELLAP